MEVVDQVMVGVLFSHPARYGIGIVLVAVPCFAGKVAVPQRVIKDLSFMLHVLCANARSPVDEPA